MFNRSKNKSNKVNNDVENVLSPAAANAIIQANNYKLEKKRKKKTNFVSKDSFNLLSNQNRMKIDKNNFFQKLTESFELDIAAESPTQANDKGLVTFAKKAAIVKCKIMFSRMGTINTIRERFDCEAFVECSWEDDELFRHILNSNNGENNTTRLNTYYSHYYHQSIYKRAMNNLKTFRYDPRMHWSPNLYIDNAIGDLKEEKQYKLEIVEKARPGSSVSTDLSNVSADTQPRDTKFIDIENPQNNNDLVTSPYTAKVVEMKFIKGTFYERLELYDFPMDLQELSITITSQMSENEIQFVENKQDPSGIWTEVFLNQQEWYLFDYVKCSTKTINDTFKNIKRPGFSVTSFIARKPGYYINNAYFLVFLITALGFVPFSVDLKQPNARCLVTGVLLLTQVNFRWIITQRIPSVSYLTSIDKFAIGNLFFLILFAVWHAIVGSQVLEAFDRLQIDAYVLIGFGAFFVLYTVTYILWMYRLHRRMIKKRNNKDD